MGEKKISGKTLRVRSTTLEKGGFHSTAASSFGGSSSQIDLAVLKA